MDFYNVFVYGTLRKQGTNHHIIKDCECISNQHNLRGFSLYDYEHWYPYMVYSTEQDSVVGEIYKVDERVKKQLDILEDIDNNLYKFVYLPTEGFYAYIKYDDNIFDMPKIEGGDWISYIVTLKL
ncbi:gamma-glutamylcyclotransferase family protein [Catalinimonas sp. 4WD22]